APSESEAARTLRRSVALEDPGAVLGVDLLRRLAVDRLDRLDRSLRERRPHELPRLLRIQLEEELEERVALDRLRPAEALVEETDLHETRDRDVVVHLDGALRELHPDVLLGVRGEVRAVLAHGAARGVRRAREAPRDVVGDGFVEPVLLLRTRRTDVLDRHVA